MAGIDPMRFLLCEDPFEVKVMQEIARRRQELDELHDRNRATLTANEIWRGIGG
jgi:hypothetical protein